MKTESGQSEGSSEDGPVENHVEVAQDVPLVEGAALSKDVLLVADVTRSKLPTVADRASPEHHSQTPPRGRPIRGPVPAVRIALP